MIELSVRGVTACGAIGRSAAYSRIAYSLLPTGLRWEAIANGAKPPWFSCYVRPFPGYTLKITSHPFQVIPLLGDRSAESLSLSWFQ